MLERFQRRAHKLICGLSCACSLLVCFLILLSFSTFKDHGLNPNGFANPRLQQVGTEADDNPVTACRLGEDCISEIFSKTNELIKQLRFFTEPRVVPIPYQKQQECRNSMEKLMEDIMAKKEVLRKHYEFVDKACSSLPKKDPAQLIPYKDDEGGEACKDPSSETDDGVKKEQKEDTAEQTGVSPSEESNEERLEEASGRNSLPEVVDEHRRVFHTLNDCTDQLRSVTNQLSPVLWEMNDLLELKNVNPF